jgi:hypothetical protein
VCPDHFVDDRQAEAAAAVVARTCLVEANEALQHPVAFGFGDARPVVVEGQHHVVAAIGQRDVDATRRVPGGVLPEVAEHAPQRVGIAAHPGRTHARGAHPLGGGRAKPTHPLEGQVVKVNRCPRERHAFVGPGEHQQVLDKALNPLLFGQHHIGSSAAVIRSGWVSATSAYWRMVVIGERSS